MKIKSNPRINVLVIFTILMFNFGIVNAQNSQIAVNKLVEMGFENVRFTEKDNNWIYVIQNSTYRVEADGIVKAVETIQSLGLPKGKDCSIIVLDNNIPQISINYKSVNDSLDSTPKTNEWSVDYDVKDKWKSIKGVKLKNSSLFKVDIVVYPQLLFRNYLLTKIYQYVFNVSPAIEVSLWKGSKLTAQVIFPLHNDYGKNYDNVRPGFFTLSQSLRLPYRIFLTATVGTFSNFRWGADLKAKFIMPNERFWLDGRIGYTGKGYYENWAYNHGIEKKITGELGINYYWTKYNTQFRLSENRYLEGEYALTAEMSRHFRCASIGVYLAKLQSNNNTINSGYNGGFQFRIALPPFKLKRKGYIPRITGGTFGFKYEGGKWGNYGKTFSDAPDDDFMQSNAFNPLYIKSELKR